MEILYIYITGIIANIVCRIFALHFIVAEMRSKDQLPEKLPLDFETYFWYYAPSVFSWFVFPSSLLKSYIEYKTFKRSQDETD